MTDEEADDWRDQARHGDHVFAVAEALHLLRGEPAHCRRWGYDSVEEWTEAELGFGKRMAQEYVAIWEWLERVSPSEAQLERLRSIPVTKLRFWIRAGFKPDDLDELPRRLVETSRSRLEGKTAPTDLKRHQFMLDPIATDLLNAALVRAGELSGSTSPSHNLTVICQDFLATNAFGKPDDPEMVAQYVGRFEAAMNLNVIAFDSEWNIVAGEHHIPAVLGEDQKLTK